jgi:hypothetical protein
MPDAGCRMPDAGCRMPDAGLQMGFSLRLKNRYGVETEFSGIMNAS